MKIYQQCSNERWICRKTLKPETLKLKPKTHSVSFFRHITKIFCENSLDEIKNLCNFARSNAEIALQKRGKTIIKNIIRCRKSVKLPEKKQWWATMFRIQI
jgi:hypothetical protein